MNTPKRKSNAAPVQSTKSQAAAVAQAPVVEAAGDQALAPEAEQPEAQPAPKGAVQVEVFSLAKALGTTLTNWDNPLRDKSGTFGADVVSHAIKLVQDQVVDQLRAFPTDAQVQAVLDQDPARHSASIVGGGRTVFVFVDTVQGGALHLIGPHGEKSIPFYPAKGRAIVADGYTGFVLDATFRGVSRSVLIFQIEA